MSKGEEVVFRNNNNWRCEKCGTLNSCEEIRCLDCGEKPEEEEIKTSSLTDNMKLRFPYRIIPY